MAHIAGQSRYRSTLFPEVADDMVGADHPVRVIDAFVDTLDLAGLGFSKVEAEATGRPPYAPGDLLKLYIYGYLNQIRSSRRLEREARRNVEVMWLISRVAPSFKTIADFRKDHAKALVGVCRAFIGFCRGQALFGSELPAIDGTKIAAVASRKKVITPKQPAEQVAAIDRKIGDYLKAMDEADRQEQDAPAEGVDVTAAVEELQTRRAAIQRQAAAMTEQGLSQRVLGEEEAKLMHTANHGHQVVYNAQIAVDAKHHLIAAFDLTNEGSDAERRHGVAQGSKEAVLERQSLQGLHAQAAMHRSRQAHHRAQLLRGCERGHAPPRHGRSHLDEAAQELGRTPLRNAEMADGRPAIPGPRTGQGEGGTGAWRALLQPQEDHQHIDRATVASGAAPRSHMRGAAALSTVPSSAQDADSESFHTACFAGAGIFGIMR